jgi:hypothetical protein
MIGHIIPFSFALMFRPLEPQLFITGFLISTTIMDSPLWRIVRLWYGLPLWHSDQVPTFSIVDWIIYYYNPFGFYLVWDSSCIFPEFPNAAATFWSVVGRTTAAVIVLLWWNNRREPMKNEFFH